MAKTSASSTAASASPDPENSTIAKMAEVFKCPVCLTLPPCDIYQCNEGHLICMDCYNKLRSPNLCPTCRAAMPGVPIRNRAAEQVKGSTFMD